MSQSRPKIIITKECSWRTIAQEVQMSTEWLADLAGEADERLFQKGNMNTCSWIMDDETECGELCEGRTPFCGSHNRQLRKESENKKKALQKRADQIAKQKERAKEPRKMPNKVSPKREELNKEYFKLVEQFKKDNPLCKANVNEYCTKDTDDPHHKRGRGIYLLEVSTWLPVCRSCHSFITSHPKEAIEKGWSESRLATIKPTI
ncbi:MAG TPA: hypothetical protein VGK47_13730 [Nitrososphaeraceae archaeon]